LAGHCTVPAGSGSAAQAVRRQNPKRDLRRSSLGWDEQWRAAGVRDASYPRWQSHTG
jgi:hypothetical protein